MVLKSKKHNVQSGNTLKSTRSSSKHGHAPSTLRRHTENVKPEDVDHLDIIDDWLPQDDGVSFSLNKKGRWNLPMMLRDRISWNEASDDCKISMLERHNLKKQANCIGYLSNQGQKVEHTYFSGESVTTKKGKGKRRKRRGKKEENKEEEAEMDMTPEICYEVCYPSPKNSAVSYNRKYMSEGICEDGKRGGRKNKKRNKLCWQEELLGEEELDWEEEEEEVDLRYDEEENRSREQSILGELLELALAVDKKCEDFTFITESDTEDEINHAVPKKFGKGCAIYVDEEMTPFKEEVSGPDASVSFHTSLHRNVPDIIPVNVYIQSHSLSPSYINQVCRYHYKEAACFPRKFYIHLPRDGSYLLDNRKTWAECLDVESYIMFEEVKRLKTQTIMRVSLNGDFNMNSIGIETLLDTKVYLLMDVVRRVQDYFLMLSTDCFNPALPKPSVKQGNSSMLSDASKWQIESIMAQEVYQDVTSKKDDTGNEKCSPIAPDATNTAEEYCNVCFESLHTVSGTALKTCSHWFCNQCWEKHLTLQIREGALKLLCPAYQCTEEVDTPTLLSLVNLYYVRQHQQHLGDAVILRSSQYKWCPRPRCGKLIKVAGQGAAEEGVSVTCSCGQNMCFTCFGEAHWPASCDQARRHQHLLKKNGDYVGHLGSADDTTYVARVKRCPRCNYPMEKSGGCPHMICKCGFDFCWTCGGPYHYHGEQCTSAGKAPGRERVELTHMELHPDREGASKLYVKSVLHHRARSKPKIRQRKSDALKLMPNLKVEKVVEIKKRLDSECSVVSGTSETRQKSAFFENLYSVIEQRKELKDLLLSAAAVSTELHLLAENTAVFLRDRSIERHKYTVVNNILLHMEFLCSVLDRILGGDSQEKTEVVVSKLENMIARGKETVARLVVVLRKHKASRSEESCTNN